MTYIAGLAPTSLSGTAQGLFAATAGLATIVGSSLSGVIAGWITISGLFALTAVGHLIAAVVVAFAIRSGPERMRRHGGAPRAQRDALKSARRAGPHRRQGRRPRSSA